MGWRWMAQVQDASSLGARRSLGDDFIETNCYLTAMLPNKHTLRIDEGLRARDTLILKIFTTLHKDKYLSSF